MAPVGEASIVDLHNAVAVSSVPDDVAHVCFARRNCHQDFGRELIIRGCFLEDSRPALSLGELRLLLEIVRRPIRHHSLRRGDSLGDGPTLAVYLWLFN